MLTVIETPKFQKLADTLWTEAERLEFITWLADNPVYQVAAREHIA